MARHISLAEDETITPRKKRQSKQRRGRRSPTGDMVSKKRDHLRLVSHTTPLLAALRRTVARDTDLHSLLGRVLKAIVEELSASAGRLLITGEGQASGLQFDYQLGQPQATVRLVPVAQEMEMAVETKQIAAFLSGPTVVGGGKARVIFVPSPTVS